MTITVNGYAYDTDKLAGYTVHKLYGPLWSVGISMSGSSGAGFGPLVKIGPDTFRSATQGEIEEANKVADQMAAWFK